MDLSGLAVSLAALWMVLVGAAMMIRGPSVAAKVFQWPLVTALRLVRSAVGGLLVALGRAISGKK